MHEVSVMAGIVESVLKELEKYEVVSVEEVKLLIGELTFLGKEQLSFAYEVVTRGTKLQGSTLVYEDEPTEVQCDRCGYSGRAEYLGEEYHMSVPSLTCPKCKGRVKVLKGNACRVVSLRVIEK